MLAVFVTLFPFFRSKRLFWNRKNMTYSKMVIFIYFLKNLQHSLLQILTWLATSSRGDLLGIMLLHVSQDVFQAF